MFGSGEVHIVIPNYNGRKFLPVCLRSLECQQYDFLQITVVDNGSTDGSLEYLGDSHPRVRCINLPENRGFSAAVNVGILSSSAPYVFLLNNDTELLPDCVHNLVAAADECRDFDFFSPKMLNFYAHEQLDGAGDGYLRGGAGYRLGTMERDGSSYNQAGPVFGACAGAVLYRRTVFDRIGLFDEDFFAYLEDVDLNLRMSRAGLRGYYVPGAVVYHIGSATSGSKINPLTIRLSTRNSLYVLLKNYPLSLWFRFFPVICIYQLCWLLFAVKKRQFLPWCRGIGQVLPEMRRLRRKHAQLQCTARITVPEFAACLKLAEKSVLLSIMQRRKEQGKGNVFLRMYRRLFL